MMSKNGAELLHHIGMLYPLWISVVVQNPRYAGIFFGCLLRQEVWVCFIFCKNNRLRIGGADWHTVCSSWYETSMNRR